MTREEFEDELYDIISGNIDEPAGHGCGYGITDDGQAEIASLIDSVLKQNRKEVSFMSTNTPEAYKVTAIEHLEQIDGSPAVLPKIHLWGKEWPAADEATVEDMVKRSLTKTMETDDEVVAFLGRLKIDVSCPFPAKKVS